MPQDGTERLWHRLLQRGGERDVRGHDARHTCASLALQQAVHPKAVQEMLGHSSIAITLDLYSHAVHECMPPLRPGNGRGPVPAGGGQRRGQTGGFEGS